MTAACLAAARCQASAYIVRPNRRTLAAIEHARNLTLSMADRHALSSGSWVSVYMRRGDKAKERPLMLTDPQPFLDLATRMLNSHPGQVSPRIFLATEDVDVHRYFITQSVVPVYSTNVTRFPANT
ncbi:inner membrane translocase, partial [Haematococcus lacustris]